MADDESLFVPVAGGVQLEARVYDPRTALRGSPSPRGLAIIAHPYGSLGGCFDDHVVCAVAEHLLSKRHFEVVTFNSRGVGQSSGRASWTGASESEDYQAVTDWAMKRFEQRHPAVQGAVLMLCGYSAGSLYCSTTRTPGMSASSTWSASQGPLYVLISYPRGVLWALSLFQSARYERALDELVSGERVGRGRVLVVYGTKDDFTSAKTYESWIKTLAKGHPSGTSSTDGPARLQVEAVEGADHFWRSHAELCDLTTRLDVWLGLE